MFSAAKYGQCPGPCARATGTGDDDEATGKRGLGRRVLFQPRLPRDGRRGRHGRGWLHRICQFGNNSRGYCDWGDWPAGHHCAGSHCGHQ